MKTFRSGPLKELIRESLEKIGACEGSCFHVSESVIQTSLRGVDSHGINLIPCYHEYVLSGRANREPSFSHERTAPSVAVFDADHAFGHHAGAEAMSLAMDIAAETGVGAVSVKDSCHFGAAAYFSLMAAERDMIGLSFSNAPATVLAYNATTSYFGTNPICAAVPLRDESPFCLDMATASMPTNKLENYRRTNSPLEPGWAFDKEGRMTTDPAAAHFVGPYGGHKGYGLGMLVEIFCGLLTGCPAATEMLPMLQQMHLRQRVSHFFIAMDIARFHDVAAFKGRLQDMVNCIRNLPRADDNVPVMVPGDPEKASFARRTVTGIPVDEPMFERFLALDKRFASALS